MLSDWKKEFFDNGNIVTRLIIINVVVFVVVNLTETFLRLSMTASDARFFYDWFAVHSNLWDVVTKPWTLITYMFMHSGFFHIIFNMLVFYWFSSLLGDFIGNKKILPLFLTGGVAGALLFIIAYNVFPFFQQSFGNMVGASAGVMAILFAMATLRPDMRVQLILIGPVALKWIAITLLVVDLISLSGSNGGGSFSHIGGALFGFFYIKSLQQGRNLTGWYDWLMGLFGPKKTKMNVEYKRPVKAGFSGKPSTKELSRQDKIDGILDKISTSGYDSLSQDEKDYLFKYSKES